MTPEEQTAARNTAINFLTWVRTVDFYFVRRQQKWFGPDGSLLTEEELYDKYSKTLP